MKKKFYVASYHHRFGTDFAIFTTEPSQEDLAKYWKTEYEPEREDEYFEVSDPLKVETLKK